MICQIGLELLLMEFSISQLARLTGYAEELLKNKDFCIKLKAFFNGILDKLFTYAIMLVLANDCWAVTEGLWNCIPKLFLYLGEKL